MNKIVVNKFLLAGGKFMPEMHLRQPGFIYISCEPFTKNKERIQKFKETEDSGYIYQNKLDKACFQHDVAYGNFKHLTRRTTSDKISHDKAFSSATNPKYMDVNIDLLQLSIIFLIKKLLVEQLKMKICQTKRSLENYTNQILENLIKEK